MKQRLIPVVKIVTAACVISPFVAVPSGTVRTLAATQSTVQTSTGATAESRANNAMNALITHYWNPALDAFHNSYPIDSPGNNYWWQANAIDALAEGVQLHLAAPCAQLIASEYTSVTMGGTALTSYFDDENWMGLAFLDAYQTTHQARYLTVAEQLFSDVSSQGWQTRGGVVWNQVGSTYRNTPANAPAALLGASLYQITKKKSDLLSAEKIFAWEWRHLVSPDGVVWDGLQGDVVNESQYSYNYGTVIGAAVQLWKDTHRKTYLVDAERVGMTSLSQFTAASSSLVTSAGQGDGGLFNGIYVRYLAWLARFDSSSADRAKIRNTILENANHAWVHDRASDGVFGDDWSSSGSFSSVVNVDLSTELSAVFLMNQADFITGHVTSG